MIGTLVMCLFVDVCVCVRCALCLFMIEIYDKNTYRAITNALLVQLFDVAFIKPGAEDEERQLHMESKSFDGTVEQLLIILLLL